MARDNPRRLDGLGDSFNDYRTNIQPNPSAPQPPGPANFPISTNAPQTDTQLLQGILRELKAQNNSGKPIMRCKDVDDTGATLDWSMIGLMDRFAIRNEGPNSVWIGFDISGPSVDAFTSDLSYELQSQESLAMYHCQFFKIGCICASGKTGTVHCLAFKAVAGNLGLAIT